MRVTQLFSVLLGIALAATLSMAHAAPTTQSEPPTLPYSWQNWWQTVQQPQWDTSRQWYGRDLKLKPVAGLPGPIDVRVVVPAGAMSEFTAPSFVPLVRQQMLPALTQVFPQTIFQQTPLRIIRVQPDVYVLSSPSLFWAPDQAVDAYTYAAYLAKMNTNFVPWLFNGPRGYGVYLAYHLPPSS